MRKSFRAKLTNYLYGRISSYAFPKKTKKNWAKYSKKYRNKAIQTLLSSYLKNLLAHKFKVSVQHIPQKLVKIKYQQLNHIRYVKNRFKNR